MLILYEYAACLLAALIGGTFLFTASSMCMMFWGAGGLTWRWWRKRSSLPDRLREDGRLNLACESKVGS